MQQTGKICRKGSYYTFTYATYGRHGHRGSAVYRPTKKSTYNPNPKNYNIMKKRLYLLLTAAAVLLCLPVSLTSCGSDDDDGVAGSTDLPTPQYEEVSGKYTVTSPGSPYESIELGASGNYIVTLSYGGGYNATAGKPATGRRRSAPGGGRGALTRATQYDGVIYGTFTSLGGNRYALEGFGTVGLEYSGGNVTGIEVTTQDGRTTQYDAKKEPTMGGDDMTNALCRTWRIEKIRDVYYDKETGERYDMTVTPDNPGEDGYDMPTEVMWSKSGTYLVSYLDGSIGLAKWKWKSRKDGTLYYAWDGEWTGDYCTITFDGNRAVIHDKWEDEYGSDESWTYLVTDDAAAETPGTDLPEGQSPLGKVFTGKLLKEMDGDSFVYENGYLTQITNGKETITFNYNYATGADGPDVYVTMRGDGDDDFAITLNEQGFAEKIVQTSHDYYGESVYTKTFEYDADGHVTALKDDRNGRDYTLTWTDGDLTKVSYVSERGNVSYYDYAYGSGLNSNGIMMYYRMFSVDLDEVELIYYAGLLGKAPRHLLASETSDEGNVTTYTWTDNSFTMTGDSGSTSTKYFSFMD